MTEALMHRHPVRYAWLLATLAATVILASGCDGKAQSVLRPLQGSYHFGGPNFMEGVAGEAEDPHVRFHLKGDAARQIFERMQVEAVRDMCLDDGTMTKWVGPMQCSAHEKRRQYDCFFAIDINDQQIRPGIVC